MKQKMSFNAFKIFYEIVAHGRRQVSTLSEAESVAIDYLIEAGLLRRTDDDLYVEQTAEGRNFTGHD